MSILCIDGCRCFSWRVVEMQRPEVGDFKFDANAAMLLVAFEEACDKFQVVVKGPRKLLQSFLI